MADGKVIDVPVALMLVLLYADRGGGPATTFYRHPCVQEDLPLPTARPC